MATDKGGGGRPAGFLEGMWFLTFRQDGGLDQQGRIAAVDGGWAIVRYHDWVMGEYHYSALVKLDAITSWQLFDTAEAVRAAIERAWAAEAGKGQRQEEAGAG
jgi:hypothetical protein